MGKDYLGKDPRKVDIVKDETDEDAPPPDADQVFRIVDRGNFEEIEALVMNPNISLGLVDPVDGITLVHDLLTKVTNGNELIMKKLDACVSTTTDDVDSVQFAIKIDHKFLVDEDPRSLKVLRDLLLFDRTRTFCQAIFKHPVVVTFIERRWPKLWFYVTAFIYLVFVLNFTFFSVAMFTPYDDHPFSFGRYLGLVCSDYSYRSNDTCILGETTRSKLKIGVLEGCQGSDLGICGFQLVYFFCLIFLCSIEFLQSYSLGIEYFREPENWFELTIYILAIFCFFGTGTGPVLSVIAAITTCLMWIQLITLVGRFPSGGGMFSLMYYASSQKVLEISVGLGLLSVGYGFSFYILQYNFKGTEIGEERKSLLKSLVQSFVWIMGGYDFDSLWDASSEAQNYSEAMRFIPVRALAMFFLITSILFGVLIMINLIVAFIICDIHRVREVTELTALRNQAHHAVQTSTLRQLIDCLTPCYEIEDKEKEIKEADKLLVEHYCMHTVCRCGLPTLNEKLSNRLLEIVGVDHRVSIFHDMLLNMILKAVFATALLILQCNAFGTLTGDSEIACEKIKERVDSSRFAFDFKVDENLMLEHSRACRPSDACFSVDSGYVEDGKGYRVDWTSGAVTGHIGEMTYSNISECYSEITLWSGGRINDLHCCDGYYKVSQPEETVRIFTDPREQCCNKFLKTTIKRKEFSDYDSAPVVLNICGDQRLVIYRIIIFEETRTGTLKLRNNLPCCPGERCAEIKHAQLSVIIGLSVILTVSIAALFCYLYFRKPRELS